jgi:hypothetical protein
MADSPFDTSHLHGSERARIASGDLSRNERDKLMRGENPWPKPEAREESGSSSTRPSLDDFWEGIESAEKPKKDEIDPPPMSPANSHSIADRPEPKSGIQALQEEVDRAGKVMEQATELLWQRAKEQDQANALERAVDNALKRAEDRARTKRDLEEFGRRLGFTPIGEMHRETFGQKLADSNLFWGGGVGMVLVALSFEWGHVPPRVTIVMLAVAWLIISISTYRHRFFENRPRWVGILGNIGMWLTIGMVLAFLWYLFRPQ